jgi:4-oxalocrotonate tautomerase
MPLINVKILGGVFTPEQKKDMITKLTDTMVSIEGENLRPATLVVIEEVQSGDWAVGGNAFTTKDVKALAAGKPTV